MEYDNDVNHPRHYTRGFASRSIECIDITRHLSFNMGNAVKYIWRAGKKGDHTKALEDLQKARWYIEDERWRCAELYPTETHRADESATAMARALMDLVARPPLSTLDSRRYMAIRTLLQGLFVTAEENIAVMERMIRNDKSNSFQYGEEEDSGVDHEVR